MKKFLAATCAFAATCMMLSGCALFTTNTSENSSSEETKLSAPVDLKINNKGVLSWDDVENATAYELVIGDQVTTLEDNKQDLFKLIKTAGTYTISVSAVGGEATTYELTAVQLEAPTTPVIVEDPETHAVKFVWEGAENTRAYLQQVNDGNWVSNTESYYEISSTGSYTISVKAKGYAANNVLYLESPASSVSETYEHKQGPVLQLLGMELINWTVEDGVTFDSYNLWVNGKKVKENVECGEEGYDIVANAAVTKTGEYNIQLEAVDNGQSYWSNMLVEVGTYNINENEIYSFDNRVANFPVKKDGISVSNEQYHGESGHSLRYDATKAEQINLVRYAREEHANDIGYKTIKKVSYWVYIEPIEGFEGNFPASDLPSVKWEKQWGDGSYKAASFVATEDVPFGEWTKVEIDNIENAYGNILILQYAWQLGQDYVIYIDDITFDEIWEEVEVADAEYEVKYTASASRIGSWQAYESTELSFGEENANTMLTVTMDVCGNAPTTLENSRFGIFNDMAANVNVTENYQFIWIDAAKISSLDTWNTITIQLKTNDEGKCYLAGVYDQADGKIDPYSIFIKNVQIAASVIDGEEAPAGSFKTGESSGYRQAFVGIATPDYEVGTLVSVEMDVYVTGEFNSYTYISWVDTVWSTSGGEVNAEYKVMESAAMTENLGKWVRISFFAKVREYEVLRMNSGYPTVDVSATEKGVYLMAANFTSSASFNYKNVEISAEESAVGTAVAAGTKKTNNADNYRQAFVGLSTDLAAGTQVTVEMEIYVTGTFDQYTYISWVDTVWTTDGGEVDGETKVVEGDKITENAGKWIKITFEATVRDFSVLRINSAYPTVDTSAYDNAVYLAAYNFKSEESFNYKNVTITANAVQPEPEPEPEPDPDPVIDGTAMPAGTEKIAGNAKQYRQAFVGLPTEFAEGTSVTVEMDIYITGTYDQYVQGIYWVDTVWTTAGGELKGVTKIVDYATMNANAGKWIHVTFEATVRDFDVLRLNDQEYATVDTSAYGTAVYLAVNSFTSAESFNYKNVTITSNVVEPEPEPDPEPEVPVIDGTAMPTGTQKTNPDKYYQSGVGFATDFPVGTLVKVDVDVYVTGTIDSYSYISWISSTYGDNAINVESKIATYDAMNASAGRWMHLEFYAFVRDFDLLRRDASYPTMDVSFVGTGVFVIASNFTSEATFNYKNVEITAEESVVGKATPAGTKKTNNADSYHQAFVGLPTDTLGAGTKVTVEMEIFVTGSYDAYSYISWVDTLWSASTGDVNNAPKIVTNDTIKASAGEWIKVKFEAVVRDFDVLRLNTAYPSMDVSSYGNAVYLVAYNFKSAGSFNYKNVVIKAEDPGHAVPNGTSKTNPDKYYQSFVGLSTDLAAGTQVTVEMEIYVTGTFDQYTYISWVDTVWTTAGGEVNGETKVVEDDKITENAGKWLKVAFTATVRDFSVLRINSAYPTVDTSAYGNAVFLEAANFTSATSFNYRNVVITAV